MCPSPDPPFESQPQGISLDELAEAFAQVMGVEPRRPSETTDTASGEPPAGSMATEAESSPGPAAATPTVERAEEEDSCPISPRTILEAMLFVGNRDNRPR
jgi:segregation and condensation protein B